MAYQTINPTTNELIKTYPDHTDQQMEEALAAAHALYKSEWSKGDIKPRLAVLRKLADIIDSRAEELAQLSEREASLDVAVLFRPFLIPHARTIDLHIRK